MAVKYDNNVDYQHLINEARKSGDLQAAAQYEQQRNAKIDSEGLNNYNKTDLYSKYLSNNGGSSTGSSAVSSGGSSGGGMDYKHLMNEAVRNGDLQAAAQYEQQRNAKIDSEGLSGYEKTNLYSRYLNPTNTPDYTKYGTYDTYTASRGYSDAKSALESANSEAIAALDQQNALAEAQIKQTAADNARQLYINYMQNKKNLPQRLSSAGYTGGMADSQKIALESGYQGDLNSNNRSLQNSLTELASALAQAKASQNSTHQSNLASLLQNASGAYDAYVQNQNALAQSDYYANIQNRIAADSTAWQQAYNTWIQNGTVLTQAQADILGVPVGTTTSDYEYKLANIALSQAQLQGII